MTPDCRESVYLAQAGRPTMTARQERRYEKKAWTPAKVGDTPGELVPGEGENPQPIDGGFAMKPVNYAEHVGWWVATQGDKFVARARSITRLVAEVSAMGGAEEITCRFVAAEADLRTTDGAQ